jgi:integrating conjugative element protein (TIGR03765 family)
MERIDSLGFCLVALLCLLGGVVFAGELTVIFDNGRASPLSVFLSPLKSAAVETIPENLKQQRLGAADIASLLPIRSKGLTPGRITPRAHDIPFARPFFLIGADAWSKRWLVQHRKALKEMAAVGLLVQANSVEDLRAIAELAEGLPVTPASGTDIAKAIGIVHYPVALSDQRIWQ